MASLAPQPRPQQPTDSPVASLPTETLAQILALALEPPRPVLVLRPFSLVCKHWYNVACAVGLEQETIVADSHQAERLAEALLQSPAERQEGIHSLVVATEVAGKNSKGGRSQRVADLLLSLPNLKRLRISFAESLVASSSEYAPFGQPLRLAVKATTTLEQLEISGYAGMRLDAPRFCSLVSNMSDLHTVRFQSPMSFGNSWADLPFSSPAKLEEIEMQTFAETDRSYHGEVISFLLESSADTIRFLCMGHISYTQLRGMGHPASRALLYNFERAAPRLIELQILDAEAVWTRWAGSVTDYLDPNIRKLSSIRRLTLGLNGIAPSARFQILATLKTLEHLSLASNAATSTEPSYMISHLDVLYFLSQADKLESLTLPRSHCRLWSDEERELIEKKARDNRVEFCLA